MTLNPARTEATECRRPFQVSGEAADDVRPRRRNFAPHAGILRRDYFAAAIDRAS
jgi:hypothetical protein